MSEIYDWMQKGLDYAPSEILLFNYASAAPLISPDPAVTKYDKSDTTKSIDGAAGSATMLRTLISDATKDGSMVDIIAHSLGGVVSLYAALDLAGQAGPMVAGKIHSITTINSPVQGISTVVFESTDFLNLIGVTCAKTSDKSLRDMYPHDPFDPNEVVEQIERHDWDAFDTLFVVTVANSQDPIISNSLSIDGERGVLASLPESQKLLQDLGGGVSDAHSLALNISSNSAAEPVIPMLLTSLIEYQLQELFLAGETYLRATPAKPPAIPLMLTSAFIGNDASNVLGHVVSPSITTSLVQTQVFIGDELSQVAMGNVGPTINTSFAHTKAFLGNESSRVSTGNVNPQMKTSFAQTKAFVGNASSALLDFVSNPFAVSSRLPLSIPALTLMGATILASFFGLVVARRLRRRSNTTP